MSNEILSSPLVFSRITTIIFFATQLIGASSYLQCNDPRGFIFRNTQMRNHVSVFVAKRKCKRDLHNPQRTPARDAYTKDLESLVTMTTVSTVKTLFCFVFSFLSVSFQGCVYHFRCVNACG